jgi:cell division protein FtsB
MITKKTVGKLFVITLIIITSKIIINGENGFYYLAQLKKENEDLIKDIKRLEINKAQKLAEINNLETIQFYSEKIARENLQMAHSNDHIFLIVKNESK